MKSVEKGGSAPEQEIFTPSDSASCGATFKDGGRYQVFANRDADGHLTTTMCSTPGTLAAGKKPYVSTEGTPPPSPTATQPPTIEQILKQGDGSGVLLAQLEAQEAAERRQRNYAIAVITALVIATATAVLLRRRRRTRRAAGAPGAGSLDA